MKKSIYFPHDCNARNDIKLIKLDIDHGKAGIGIYWCLIEMLYENNGQLCVNSINTYAKALKVNPQIIQSILTKYDLFKKNKYYYYSKSAKERMLLRQKKSDAARKASSERWSHRKENPQPAKSPDQPSLSINPPNETAKNSTIDDLRKVNGL